MKLPQDKDTETEQIAFRASVRMIKKIEEYAEKIRREKQGSKITRSDAIRMLLETGLKEVNK